MIETFDRKVNYGSIGTLKWPVGDTGAYDGPMADWQHNIETILQNVKDFNVVVQAGGCCGLYPLLYSKFFKKVHTFEPSPDNFYCLELNCKSQPNITYANVALHDTETFCYMSTGERGNVGVHHITKVDQGNIRTRTIDSLNLEHCDLIHLDVEGHEIYILRGAEKTIKKFSPVIVLEDNKRACAVSLNQLGYNYYKELKHDILYRNVQTGHLEECK